MVGLTLPVLDMLEAGVATLDSLIADGVSEDVWRDRCDELNRGLRDVAHSMLP